MTEIVTSFTKTGYVVLTAFNKVRLISHLNHSIPTVPKGDGFQGFKSCTKYEISFVNITNTGLHQANDPNKKSNDFWRSIENEVDSLIK